MLRIPENEIEKKTKIMLIDIENIIAGMSF